MLLVLGQICGATQIRRSPPNSEYFLWGQMFLCWMLPFLTNRYFEEESFDVIFIGRCIALFAIVVADSRLLGVQLSMKRLACVSVAGNSPSLQKEDANTDNTAGFPLATSSIQFSQKLPPLVATSSVQVVSTVIMRRALAASQSGLPYFCLLIPHSRFYYKAHRESSRF